MSNRGRSAKNVIVTPLEQLQGLEVRKYIGFVFGSAVHEVDLSDAIRLAVLSRGKREKTVERILRSLRHRAIEALRNNAAEAGANAVIGVRIHVWSPARNVFEAYTYGTAVEVGILGSSSRGKRGKR